MKITLTATFGEMNLEMPAEKAVRLMQTALQYACKIERESGLPAEQEMETASLAAPERFQAPKPVHKPMSRVERMFGDFRKSRAAESKVPETYSGFLMVACERCGEVRGFSTKFPTSRYVCKCGYITQLRDLCPAHLKCKCGSEFTYQTNMTRERFDFHCLHCGNPVDLALNKRGTAYVTLS